MNSRIPEILDRHQADIVADWLKELGDAELEPQALSVFAALRTAVRNANIADTDTPEFAALRDLLASMSRSRALQTTKPSDAATFIFALKRPLFDQLGKSIADAPTLACELATATNLIDGLGLYAIDVLHRNREEIALREREPNVMGRSTTDIAHDFNNLLAGIIGGINVVRSRIAKGETDGIARFMDEIVSSAYRAASLTQELLANAQLQSRASEPSETTHPCGGNSPQPGADEIEDR